MAVPERTPSVAKPKLTFWQRQFLETRTRAQLRYDIVFGLVLPVICFYLDPVVFNTNFLRGDFASGISQFKTLTYCFSAIAIAALLVSFFVGKRSAKLSAFLGGILLAGAFGSLLIGASILPLTLQGLIFFIGLFGLIPFFTAYTYLRNGMRMIRQVESSLGRVVRIVLIVAGIAFVVGPPILAHFQMKRAVQRLVDDAIRGDTQAARSDVERLRRVAWAADLEPLPKAYLGQPEAVQSIIADSYLALSGYKITIPLGWD